MRVLRLLLDQMIDSDVAADLPAAGHDVCCVADVGMKRADDAEILQLAIRENRVKGVGSGVFSLSLPPVAGFVPIDTRFQSHFMGNEPDFGNKTVDDQRRPRHELIFVPR